MVSIVEVKMQVSDSVVNDNYCESDLGSSACILQKRPCCQVFKQNVLSVFLCFLCSSRFSESECLFTKTSSLSSV